MSALCQKQQKRIISSITADELHHTSPRFRVLSGKLAVSILVRFASETDIARL